MRIISRNTDTKKGKWLCKPLPSIVKNLFFLNQFAIYVVKTLLNAHIRINGKIFLLNN